jgi:hypothetical protein
VLRQHEREREREGGEWDDGDEDGVRRRRQLARRARPARHGQRAEPGDGDAPADRAEELDAAVATPSTSAL